MPGPDIPRPAGDAGLVDHALRYLRGGWSVVPVGPDKRPRLNSWKEYQRRLPTESEVRAWWGARPDSGVGVLTGAISGIIVVDADSEAGAHTAAGYAPGGTLTATTGGGGHHFYFKHPGRPTPNAVRFAEGLDLRGDGGLVVVPPSPHQSGRSYSWDNPGADILPMPDNLLAVIGARSLRPPLDEGDWSSGIAEGERDQELTRRCGRLLRSGMGAAEAEAALLYVNSRYCRPPLHEEQVRKIVRSIAGRERERAAAVRTDGFTVVSQREMLRRFGEDEQRWTVEEWLPDASCGLIVAPPGNFKTWMLAALAFSVATGRPFLGHWGVLSPGPVLFIQQEDPWGMLQGRMGRMFEQEAPSERGDEFSVDCRYVDEFDRLAVHWYTDRQLSFSNRDVVSRLEAKVAELRPRLVMIDPLYTAADTRDYMAEGAQRMVALKLMRDRYGCSFIVAHHTTVAGSASEGREAIWGSQFLNAWLEFGWRMPKGDEHGSLVIRHFKGAESPKRIRLLFKITNFSFGADVDEAPQGTTSERIEEAIMSGGSGSMRDIAKAVGCNTSTVSRVARRMGLEKDGDGRLKPRTKG